jgi:hypothetical protein
MVRFGGTSSAQVGRSWVGGIENVGYIGGVTKFLSAVVSIEQIYRNVSDAIGWLSTAPRWTDNVPVAERSQIIQKVPADNPLSSDYQRYLVRCANLKKCLQVVNSARSRNHRCFTKFL